MTSSALFIMVAESTDILRPITQFGCAQACSGVTSCSVKGSRVRKGPPEAVSTILSTLRDQVDGSSGRDWNTAECSLSIGRSVAPPSRTACMNRSPATTSASLLASSSFLPARAAARLGASPAAPTMAAITASTPGSLLTSHSACGPASTSTGKPSSLTRRARSCACAGLAITAYRGTKRWHWARIVSTWVAAVSAKTEYRSGWRPITSSVFAPMEPVEPRMVTA